MCTVTEVKAKKRDSKKGEEAAFRQCSIPKSSSPPPHCTVFGPAIAAQKKVFVTCREPQRGHGSTSPKMHLLYF